MNSSELKDYYGLLNIPQSATVGDIHKAYWQMASRCHPDRGGSHEAMVQLVEAWKILSDPVKRARYDQLFKYRHNGWHNRKFNDDVQAARKRAAVHSKQSWEEFEAIYQKAFFIFNQDFYGDDMKGKTSGPYSPLMESGNKGARSEIISGPKPEMRVLNSYGGTMFLYIMKTLIIFVAILAGFLFYQNYSGIGRYVPLEQQDTSKVLILDTVNGAVYSAEKRDGSITSPWKESVSPFTRK